MEQGCDLQRRKKRGNHISCRSAQISRITILTLKSKKKILISTEKSHPNGDNTHENEK